MTKPSCNNVTDTKDWVIVSFDWNGDYLMPVEAAAKVLRIIIKSGAVRIRSLTVGKPFYVPKELDLKVECLDQPFFADVPVDESARKGYMEWLTTKYEIIGKDYEPEPYAAYLAAKEDGYVPANL